jgi:hypothetical protein
MGRRGKGKGKQDLARVESRESLSPFVFSAQCSVLSENSES